jgi:hypothetical protein
VSWWAPQLDGHELSQGDVFDKVVTAVQLAPPQFVTKAALKGGKQGWRSLGSFKLGEDGLCWLISRGAPRLSLVMSHGCEIDKTEKKKRIIVAPVGRIETISDPTARALVLGEKRFSLMPLPGLPGIGDCYADLRLIQPVPREALQARHRLASMTEDGRLRLQAQVERFFTRRDLPAADERGA